MLFKLKLCKLHHPKKHFFLMRIFFLSLLLSWAWTVQGQNLISNGDFENGTTPWGLWADQANGYQATLTSSNAVVHQGQFAGQLQVSQVDATEPNPRSRIWHVQLSQGGFMVNQGEELRASFWMRASSPGKLVELQLMKNAPAYDDYGTGYWELSTDWKKYEIPFVAPANTNAIQIAFRCASDTGTYYLDDIELVRTGRQIGDGWYADAEARIDSLRKGDFRLRLEDSLGNALQGYQLKVQLESHAFPWGTTLTLEPNASDPDEVWYRETAARYFNAGVFENAFKWPYMEPQQGQVAYADVDRYLNWADAQGWELRGHALVWGGDQNWQSPPWVWGLSGDSAVARTRTRILRDMRHYQGRILEYDVLNEPVHVKEFAELAGDSINHLVFEWAQEADASALRYLNDFNIITHSDFTQYRQLAQQLQAQGAPIDGLGLQGHFARKLPWEQLRLKLDYLAETGLPLKITEFDVNPGPNSLSEAQQAEIFGQVMRVAFSHPAVEGFYFWGFWDSRHWIDDAGIFRADKSAKPAADTVWHLIHQHWTTRDSGMTDANGALEFRGFYGRYRMEYEGPNQEQGSFVVNFDPQQSNQVVQIGNSNTSLESNFEREVQLLIAPNPAREFVHISIVSEKQLVGELVLFDALGKKIHHQALPAGAGNQDIMLPLEGITPGIYWVQLRTEQGQLSQKLVVVGNR
jgi:endo-1,4-beta-xylanase